MEVNQSEPEFEAASPSPEYGVQDGSVDKTPALQSLQIGETLHTTSCVSYYEFVLFLQMKISPFFWHLS